MYSSVYITIGVCMTDNNFKQFRKIFLRSLKTAKHWQLKVLSKDVAKQFKISYPRPSSKKTELIEKAFTDRELEKFMSVIKDPVEKACFLFMAILGLRVGEVTKLKGKDINGQILNIWSLKGSYNATLKIPVALLALVPKRDPEDLLFGFTKKQISDRFSRYRKIAGMNDIYCYREPGGRKKQILPLYRLSCHSLRHYAIQKVYKITKDADLSRRFARHKKLQTTLGYFSSSRKTEVENILEKITYDSLANHNNLVLRPAIVSSRIDLHRH